MFLIRSRPPWKVLHGSHWTIGSRVAPAYWPSQRYQHRDEGRYYTFGHCASTLAECAELHSRRTPNAESKCRGHTHQNVCSASGKRPMCSDPSNAAQRGAPRHGDWRRMRCALGPTRHAPRPPARGASPSSLQRAALGRRWRVPPPRTRPRAGRHPTCRPPLFLLLLPPGRLTRCGGPVPPRGAPRRPRRLTAALRMEAARQQRGGGPPRVSPPPALRPPRRRRRPPPPAAGPHGRRHAHPPPAAAAPTWAGR